MQELPPEEPVPERVDVHDEISVLGEVTHHVDDFIVIRSHTSTVTVDIDSVLCLEDRTVLGRVSSSLRIQFAAIDRSADRCTRHLDALTTRSTLCG